MKVIAPILFMLLLAACGDRRTFDQRYEDVGAELEQRASAIEKNLAAEKDAEDPSTDNSVR